MNMAAMYKERGDTLLTRSAFMRVCVSFCVYVYVRVCVCLCDVRVCIWLPSTRPLATPCLPGPS